MNILSLFDGISGGQQALSQILNDFSYYASEIDERASFITNKNFPDTIHIGDVTKIEKKHVPNNIDLLIGGSPCQSFSSLGTQSGFEGASGLFFEYVRLLEQVEPRYFLLENVASMKPAFKNEISRIMGCQPLKYNSSLMTAQSRPRYYWTNIPVKNPPPDLEISLNDILIDASSDRKKSYCIDAHYYKAGSPSNYVNRNRRQVVVDRVLPPFKILNWDNVPDMMEIEFLDGKSHNGLIHRQNIRKLHPIEVERLQGFPDNYTEGIPKTDRYRCLGNSFTVPIIRHILSYMEIR